MAKSEKLPVVWASRDRVVVALEMRAVWPGIGLPLDGWVFVNLIAAADVDGVVRQSHVEIAHAAKCQPIGANC